MQKYLLVMECNPKLECDFIHIVTSNFHLTAKTAFAHELALNFITYNTNTTYIPSEFFLISNVFEHKRKCERIYFCIY